MKLLKSKSAPPFQSGIIGSPWFIAIGSTSMFGSKAPKSSKLYMGLLKSIASSIIMLSLAHDVRDKADGSSAPVFMNVDDTMGDSCFTGDTSCDCRGNGLFIGGVGGALCRAKGFSNANDRVVGVPPADEFEDA